MERIPEEFWPRLSPGTQVGDWRVEAWQGQGAYGAVYRALRVAQEHSSPGALKLSLYPWDARFAREVELLSRLHHPSIPRLIDRGLLRLPAGTEHPFFVMEWVDGTPLYSWAQHHATSHRQVCQLLAQLARALEATHAAGAVHRDVKGDNVLVRHSDGRALLVDFGSSHFQGAPRLTWESLAPCTPSYLSAQAWLFHLRSGRERDLYYPPSLADDLYALGVTAYRLVMGEYPPPLDVRPDESGSWHVASPDPRPLLENNPRVQPLLREWIVRLLSDDPKARGTAAQLAEALEAAEDEKVPELQPTAQPAAEASPLNAPTPAGGGALPERPRPPSPARVWRPWLAVAVAGACAVLLWSLQPVPVPSRHVFESTQQASDSQAPDAGTAAVGDTSPTEPRDFAPPLSEQGPIAQQPPPEPHHRQARPDEKGRCPGRKQVVINGACWAEIPSMSSEECTENGYVLLKGKCLAPSFELPRKPPPTAGPAKPR